MTVNGYSLYLKSKGLNHFQKKEDKGWAEIVCTDEQLKNGDIGFMTEHGLTLGKERIKKHQKKHETKNN
jgi:hypothetical protein